MMIEEAIRTKELPTALAEEPYKIPRKGAKAKKKPTTFGGLVNQLDEGASNFTRTEGLRQAGQSINFLVNYQQRDLSQEVKEKLEAALRFCAEHLCEFQPDPEPEVQEPAEAMELAEETEGEAAGTEAVTEGAAEKPEEEEDEEEVDYEE